MQAVRQHSATMRLSVITYVLKALVVLFGAMVLAAYGYKLFVSLTSDTVRPAEIILPVVLVIIPFVLGWLIDRRHPGHMIALLFLVMAYSSAVAIIGTGVALLNESHPNRYSPLINSLWPVLGHTLWLPWIYIPVFFMPLYFPTGKLPSPRWRVLVALVLFSLAWTVITVALRPWPWPAYGITETRAINGIPGSEQFFDAVSTFSSILPLLVIPFVVIAMVRRFRQSRGVEHVQMKWPLFAIVCVIGVGAVFLSSPALLEWDAQSDYLLTWSLAMLFPISIGLAILRHGLWDIDIIISRTLVYGSLTALIVAIYIAVIGGLGMLFQAQTNALSGLVAAGIIALLFQPLRSGLQRRVNRLLYGERDDPAMVLTRLAHHVQTAESPSAILPNLVETIAHTLRIPHVAIWLPGDVQRTEPVAAWGEAPDNTQSVPLTYQQETIGHLVVAPRGPNEQFSQQEQDLLATIAALTTTTVRAVQLSDELHRSRRHIVAAREDERRRLRRDLHDGLGPQLASQTLGLEAVAQLMPANPEKAQALLDSLKTQAQEAILDVRRLVYDLRPPALDDLGLIGALQQSASRYETGALRFTFDLPQTLPELPAAVETAVYRIAQEAMTNVVRHARATRCIVRLLCTDDNVVVEIRDNGRGLPPNHHSGVGLQAMKERSTELNGQYRLESLPGGGTLVQATLPLEVYGE